MTNDTAVPLQPGRELDALVAERVMGWTAVRHNEVAWYGRPPAGDEFHQFMTIDIPHFSTGLIPAMRVWEKLPKPRRLHETGVGIVVMCGGRSLGPDTDFIHDAIAMGGTIAHAICLAALKHKAAKEVE